MKEGEMMHSCVKQEDNDKRLPVELVTRGNPFSAQHNNIKCVAFVLLVQLSPQYNLEADKTAGFPHPQSLQANVAGFNLNQAVLHSWFMVL